VQRFLGSNMDNGASAERRMPGPAGIARGPDSMARAGRQCAALRQSRVRRRIDRIGRTTLETEAVRPVDAQRTILAKAVQSNRRSIEWTIAGDLKIGARDVRSRA
jgi:hypothetical protein